MAGRRLTQRQQERIRRLHERRRAHSQQPTSTPDETGLGAAQTGLVITHYGANLVVENRQRQLYHCTVRQNLGRLACGDRVIWQASSKTEGVVVAVTGRRSLLTRPDYHGQPKPVAANLDTVAIVLAPKPDLSEALIDRYLVAISAIGARGLLVLNKLDLLDKTTLAMLRERLAEYEKIGYPLLLASSHTAHGLDTLRDRLCGHVSLLVGQSGVGKSSLIKALLPDRDIRIQAVSATTGHGAHTTTASTLYHLPDGGDLIDTPGVRSFELGKITLTTLDQGFPELSAHFGHCQFSDCRHAVEPDCALRTAVSRGEISQRRLDSYRQLRTELEAIEKSGRYS
ncbi:MAG: ribosome small subunit-dependent GTPase [Candidatus Contendobacter odensis]|uniref:Small ribosomal subunit biogenesis GTPase RsgA n=1 Tax=Candidatus Contendibacter odensensis TaxID=1400860 RepID=A0A2G6PFU1_9GAMM|nr:MAG: ribosome small subunit-dependent GTPase [Candidatus Contendobacter odensis]